MPHGISISSEEDSNEKRNLTSRKLSSRIEMMVGDLVAYGKLTRQQFVQDLLKDSTAKSFAVYYKK